jgi:hypothetical protein
MSRVLLVLLVGGFYVLHQDVWLWHAARPLVFGVLPVGLFYHACYTVAASAMLGLLARHAWPSHLDPSAARADQRSLS